MAAAERAWALDCDVCGRTVKDPAEGVFVADAEMRGSLGFVCQGPCVGEWVEAVAAHSVRDKRDGGGGARGGSPGTPRPSW